MKKIIRILVVTYLAYLLLVVLVVTPLANFFLVPLYQKQTGRVLLSEGIGIDPFSLTVFLHHSEDHNPSGEVLWSVDELSINISLASLLGKGAVLDGLGVKSLYVHPQKNSDGSWVFDDILKYRAALPASPETPAEKETEPGLPAITIHHIDFHAQHLGYTDLARPEPFTASLEEIRISLLDFSTVVEEGHPYHLIARDESGGELEWKGTLSVPASHSEGELYLRKISLMPVWRFMQSDVNFRMHSAFLDMGGQYSLSWKDAANLDYQIRNGQLTLSDIDISPKSERESGLQIGKILLDGISVNADKKTASARSLDLDNFRGTVSILEDGRTNFQSMFASTSQPSEEKPAQQTATQNTSTQHTAKPWSVALDVIRINNAAFAFNDYSVEPDFRVRIQDFGGDIKPLSSDVKKITTVNLGGNVDGYAPVTLKGSLKPLATPPDLDLAFDFRGIELSSFAPYSGTYAGYRIDSGILNVSLHYHLQQNRIKGSNRVVINQLALGERVKSPRLIDLPLRLALALLTDENGVMDLDVEVSGNTQSPDFAIGKIIWKAFRNVIVKAVTAPFRLLADLVGGDVSEFVAFEPGSAVLQESSKPNLASLQKALGKRPQLSLGLSGLYSEEDRLALKIVQFHQVLKADGLDEADISEQSRAFRRSIDKRYVESWPGDNQDVALEYKHLRLAQAQPNPELQLEQLRQDRAMALKLYLLQDLKMDPGRVYLDKSLHEDRQHAVKLLLEPRA